MKRFLLLFFSVVGLSLVAAKGQDADKGYSCYVDLAVGDAYNFNTAQLISTNNMQLFSVISTTHGYRLKNWFVGGGVGYYHSFRDGENMFPVYAAGRYSFEDVEMKPYIETRAGLIYDPQWVRKVQVFGTLGGGVVVYDHLHVGMRFSLFSRPSRFFTANAAIVVSYSFGR
jgi:hypothetical protein